MQNSTKSLLGRAIKDDYPFYERVMKPLTDMGKSTECSLQNRKTWDAMLMMLFAYAKAETMFDSEYTPMFEQLRTQWGAFLGTVIDDAYRSGGKE